MILPCAGAAGAGLRVLLVDDTVGYREQARLLLNAGGLDVVAEAGTVLDALQAAHRAQPDVAVVDIGLPDGTGFELSRQLTIDGAASMVLLVSSRDWDRAGERAAAVGAAGFLPKDRLSARAVVELWEARRA